MMRRLSLRWRLNLLLSAMLVLSLLVNFALIGWNAGPRVAAESESDETLARELVETVLGSLQQTPNPEPLLQGLLVQLQNLRHVRIMVAQDRAQAQTLMQTAYSSSSGTAPHWFVRLFAQRPSATIVPATIHGRNYGDIVIAANPSGEVTEIWTEVCSVAATTFAFGVCLFILILILVGRALTPIADVGAAITRLAHGDTDVKLIPRGPPEFVDIGTKINGLADNLAKVNAENHRLMHQMMRVQDEERGQIARDLHDEMGPPLFCIRANVSALSQGAPSPTLLKQNVGAIGEQAEAIQTLLRRLLQRLRPPGLDELGLAEALRTLVGSWRAAHPDIEISLDVSDDFGLVGEAIELAAYRVVQESLTNIFRHAQATKAEVRLDYVGLDHADGAAEALRVVVEDDGIGIRDTVARGLGLTGMNERVQACGGRLIIEPGADRGTRVEAIFPLTQMSELALGVA
jgi:two-component system, NarL family, sensor histidine kinase UhpB